MEQIASSVRLKQRSHGRTRSLNVSSDSASRRLCSLDCFSKWYVNRSAVLRPIPGNLESSVARSSMADIYLKLCALCCTLCAKPKAYGAWRKTLERKLERQIHPTRQLAHL